VAINVGAGSLDRGKSSARDAEQQPDLRGRLRQLPDPKFRTLLIGHDPLDPAEATLVLAAAAAFCGRARCRAHKVKPDRKQRQR
jgi:hypothetical protein